MANIIQNESRKIALTADQLNALKKAYNENITKQTEMTTQASGLTNDAVVQQIVNNNTNSMPQTDVLISDTPVNTVAPTQPVNMFESVPIVDNPVASNPVGNVGTPNVSEPKIEEQAVSVVPGIQQADNVASDNKDLAELTKKIIDEYYDLQLHVQEYGVKLEETLEKMKKLMNENNLTKQVTNTTNTATQQVVEPPTVGVASQVASAGTNVFDAPKTEPVAAITPEQPLASPYSENINIFDQMPQTPSNGGQIKM